MHLSRPAPVSKRELPIFRIIFALAWIFVIGILPWIFWDSSQATFPIWIPVVLSVTSVPIGYTIGYKWRMAPWGGFISTPEKIEKQ